MQVRQAVAIKSGCRVPLCTAAVQPPRCERHSPTIMLALCISPTAACVLVSCNYPSGKRGIPHVLPADCSYVPQPDCQLLHAVQLHLCGENQGPNAHKTIEGTSRSRLCPSRLWPWSSVNPYQRSLAAWSRSPACSLAGLCPGPPLTTQQAQSNLPHLAMTLGELDYKHTVENDATPPSASTGKGWMKTWEDPPPQAPRWADGM